MGDVVFARPRHAYDSYSDYRRLVELSGYAWCYVDEIDAYDSTKCYIVTPLNGEWEQGWPDAKATLIHWDLEWRLVGAYPVIPGVRRTWTSDAWYAKQVNAEYVPLGSDARLNPEPDVDCPKLFDVAMLAYMGPPRRQQVQYGMQQRGVSFAPNSWGMERHATLQATRLMAHVHQLEGVYTVAAQRFCLAAAYRLPLITETLADPGIFAGKVLTTDAAHYADFVSMWLAGDGNRLRDYGAALHYLLCVAKPFRKCVEAAL